MDTINALHDSFKEASAELERGQERVLKLENELKEYKEYKKRLDEEEEAVTRSVHEIEEILKKERNILDAKEIFHLSKLLQLDVLHHKVNIFPQLLCERIEQAAQKNRNAVIALEKSEELTSHDVSSKRYATSFQTAKEIAQTRLLLKLTKEQKVDEREKLSQSLQATLNEERETLSLLQACIDGMIRKNQQLRNEERASSQQPADVENDHSKGNATQPSPSYEYMSPVEDEIYSTQYPPGGTGKYVPARKQNNGDDGSSDFYQPFSSSSAQWPSPPAAQSTSCDNMKPSPWYMLNKKKQRIISTTTTNIPGGNTTITTTKETFRSGSEILQLEQRNID